MSRRPPLRAAAALIAVAATITACGSGGSDSAAPVSPTEVQTVHIGQNARGTAAAVDLQVTPDPAIRAKLPARIRDAGVLVIGVGALPAGFPPLAFVGDDQRTLTGSEPDLGRLVAAVLGLRADVQNASWENLFVRLSSGQFDVGFSNITDTELRKEKYDFASYRKDDLAFEVLDASPWNFDGDYGHLSGRTVAVGSGTNQEKILLEWGKKLTAAGRPGITVRYFNDTNAQLLALRSGRIDIYFGPNPSVQYQIAQNANRPNPLRTAGTYSGAGATLQGLIAATTKKGNGLVTPLNDALNYLIRNGQYAKWLAAYHLGNEALPKAETNPPGLPRSDT